MSINNTSNIAIKTQVASPLSLAIGIDAGSVTQDDGSVALGYQAAQINQGGASVAIGYQAGQTNQTSNGVAIGLFCGFSNQGQSVAIGKEAASSNQGDSSIAIGSNAGNNTQGIGSIALGLTAGQLFQSDNGIAIGNGAGNDTQGLNAIAIGTNSGIANQADNSICIGNGSISLGSQSIAIGVTATSSIYTSSIALGTNATSTANNQAILGSGINWSLDKVYDLSNVLSIDCNLRKLYANDGTTLKIDWSDPSYTIFNSVQGVEFVIAPGAAPVINYIKVNGAPTGNSPIFTSVGSDTDVSMTFMSQNHGDIDFTTGDGGLLLLQSTVGAVNFFIMANSATGNAPNLRAFGTDTNVNLQLSAQGSGVVFSNNPIHADGGFTAKDASSVASINSITRQEFDSSGVLSNYYGFRQLFDASAVISVGWNARVLYGTSGALTSVNWGTRRLYNSAGTAIVCDWSTQVLNDSTQIISLDWNNRQLWDATSLFKSQDWNTRQLFANNGSTVAVDYSLAAGTKFQGLQVSEAANGKQGIATLVAGTVTVSNTSITANSRIDLFAQDSNTIGALHVSSRVVGTSFTITSSLNIDTGVVAYEIFEPA